jgi:hypothetical protein
MIAELLETILDNYRQMLEYALSEIHRPPTRGSGQIRPWVGKACGTSTRVREENHAAAADFRLCDRARQ